MSPSRPSDNDEPARRFPAGGPSAAETQRLRGALLELRAKLAASSEDLADEALKSSGQDFSIDHLADHGSDNAEQDISISLLEGETEILQAIDTALRKIAGNEDLPYGICEACAEHDAWPRGGPAPWIPTGRLEVMPYAIYCVAHQEEQEEVGA